MVSVKNGSLTYWLNLRAGAKLTCPLKRRHLQRESLWSGKPTEGTCCPGVSRLCHCAKDGEALPEQFIGRAMEMMLKQA